MFSSFYPSNYMYIFLVIKDELLKYFIDIVWIKWRKYINI